MLKEYPAISIDIETMNLTEEELKFEASFVKHHPATKDETKQEMQIAKKQEALKKRGALTDSAEIACISIALPDGEVTTMHTMHYSLQSDGMLHKRYDTEAEMLEAFRDVMDVICTQETVLVVAGADFDLPKLRLRAVLNHVDMPRALMPESLNPVYDVLYMFGKYFMTSRNGQYQVNLDEIAKRLRIDMQGKAISGKDVPDMIESGQYKEVILYNRIDAMITMMVYAILSGTR